MDSLHRDVLLRVDKDDAKPAETVLDVKNLSVGGKNGIAVKILSCHPSLTISVCNYIHIDFIYSSMRT